MKFAQILRAHWPQYVKEAEGKIPSAHWRAVEAVLSCRTERRGGSRHFCPDCKRVHYRYHSCNHRSCPQCGSADQAQWSAAQEAKLLPVTYFLVTVTVPAELRITCRYHPRELYGTLLSQSAQGLSDLFKNPKHFGGRPGFIAVLQTWTRQMMHHPHVHMLVPAVALAEGGCQLVHPKTEEFLVHVKALARHTRNLFRRTLAAKYPELLDKVDPKVWATDWGVDCREAGSGRSALRYLASYVCKSAFNEDRLVGYDDQGRILLRYQDSSDRKSKIEPVTPHELIRRWLLHVLPKGFVAIRHFGWLSPAASRALNRVRFLLGRGPVVKPRIPKQIPECPQCKRPMLFAGATPSERGPPLSRMSFPR